MEKFIYLPVLLFMFAFYSSAEANETVNIIKTDVNSSIEYSTETMSYAHQRSRRRFCFRKRRICKRPIVAKFTQSLTNTLEFDFKARIKRINVRYPASYTWYFGDGNTSTQRKPNHVYASAGSYNVMVVVDKFPWSTRWNCVDTAYLNVVIGNQCNVVADFTSRVVGSQVSYLNTSTSSSSSLSYSWDLGDGNSSSLQSPIHTYASTGTYSACLTVTDLNDTTCKNTICKQVSVVVDVCAISASYSSSIANDTVSFTNLTSFSNTYSGTGTYLWDFGDGNSSSAENPTHIYGAAGTYTVCLTSTRANDASCIDQVCMQLTTTLPQPTCPSNLSEFTYSVSGNNVSYQADYICGTCSYSWTLGDGSTSNQSSLVKNYFIVASYNVSLTVDDGNGCTSQTSKVVNMSSSQRWANPNAEENNDIAIGENIEVSLYPNPVSSELNIQIDNEGLGQNYQVEIYDVIGNKVMNQNFEMNSSLMRLNTSDLKQGNYSIRLIDISTQEFSNMRFVKK